MYYVNWKWSRPNCDSYVNQNIERSEISFVKQKQLFSHWCPTIFEYTASEKVWQSDNMSDLLLARLSQSPAGWTLFRGSKHLPHCHPQHHYFHHHQLLTLTSSPDHHSQSWNYYNHKDDMLWMSLFSSITSSNKQTGYPWQQNHIFFKDDFWPWWLGHGMCGTKYSRF